MDGSLCEAAAAHNQVHGWSSYSLSIPSQPPDIRNWFSSYEYESPGDPIFVADLGAHSGSETQDPFEHLPRDDGVAVKENRFGDQSENEFADRKDLAPSNDNESTAQKPPKRKRSLRALFGFLEEATEPELQVALPVQRNAQEPLPVCNATGLLDTKQSQEGVISDGQGISSADTQFSSPHDQEVECSELPVPCVSSSLADIQNCVHKDNTEHGNVLVDLEGISSVKGHVSSPVDEELEYCKLPVKCVSSSLADTQNYLPKDSTDSIQHDKMPVDSDGISSVDTQVGSPADQEVECSKPSVTAAVSSLADIHQKDSIDSFEMPINVFGTNLANTEKGSKGNILPVSPRSNILADSKENSSVKEIGRVKPALDSKKPEQTVTSNGFIVVKRKHRLQEECEMNKIAMCPVRRGKAGLQENHNVLGQKVSVQVHTRSPLADRTNFTEAAATRTAEFCGKWKCPSKGKPHVGPPMKQLRLDQWLR